LWKKILYGMVQIKIVNVPFSGTFPYYPDSTNIPGITVFIGHACIKPSIKALKYN
jgi:hypothetical protein